MSSYASTDTTISTATAADGNYHSLVDDYSIPPNVKGVQVIDNTNIMYVSTDDGATEKPHAAGVPFSKLRDGDRVYNIENIKIKVTSGDVVNFEWEI